MVTMRVFTWLCVGEICGRIKKITEPGTLKNEV